MLGEYDQTGKVIQETVWLGDMPIATVRPTTDPANPKVYYVWADHLGTPRQITDPVSNALVWRWDGEPFGNSQPNQDPASTGTQFEYNLRNAGQISDKETGLFYNGNRTFNSGVGAFNSSDPIGLAAGSNSTYSYVGNRPTGAVDPSGLFSMSPETLEKAVERALAAEVVGGGPEDPFADIAAAVAIISTVSTAVDVANKSNSKDRDRDDCKCRNKNHPTLYRSGNASGPRLDNVRVPKDIVVGPMGLVHPNTGGLSSFSTISGPGVWWSLPANFPIPPGLCLKNDRGNHWLLEPAVSMPYNSFVNQLESTAPAWSRVY